MASVRYAALPGPKQVKSEAVSKASEAATAKTVDASANLRGVEGVLAAARLRRARAAAAEINARPRAALDRWGQAMYMEERRKQAAMRGASLDEGLEASRLRGSSYTLTIPAGSVEARWAWLLKLSRLDGG